MTATKTDIRRAIDRFGADTGNWPDRSIAQAARAAALADPEVRNWLAEARALAVALDRARIAIDDEVEASGAVARVTDAVFDGVGPGRQWRSRWIAVAATLLIAAGVGGAVQLTLETSGNSAGVDVVVLDPLVFGPAGIAQ